MSSIIEAASCGSSRSARERVYFSTELGREAVEYYGRSLLSVAQNFLKRQADLGNERIEFFAFESVVGAVAGYKVSASKRDKDASRLGGGSDDDPVIWIFAALVLSVCGWFATMIGEQVGEFGPSLFALLGVVLWIVASLSLLIGVVRLSYELWFRWKTGYYSSVIGKLEANGVNLVAFTPNYIYFCFNESDGKALGFRRHAFKDIHRVVRSDVEGELIYTAIDVSGDEMFKLSSLMMRPEGLDLAEVLEKRIQEARGATLA
ncbi:hypothetical protein [Mesorhizobium sp. SP-1A]|uniref:hypothetical protein n=1 Tax=Mesorhizobium sp. SP-1A TaxID=3077840 RepID=UPI0028F7123B|nr:hypothetical protein [Mesorhizobium sp. SP-1A]